MTDDLPKLTPWGPAGESGPELLDDVEAYLARFVAYPSAAARVAHALWIGHTWFMDDWYSTPRIAFLSPEPASGKSRALEVTEHLVPRSVHAMNMTPAYLFRRVSDEAGAPTILFDEIDTVFGPKAKDNEDLRALLNAGHRRGATAGRCVVRGQRVETEDLPAYCAVALAGLDDLPDTIMTRSVVVRMRRRAPGERVEPWRGRLHAATGSQLGQRLSGWADGTRDRLDPAPGLPDSIQDRDADVWEPLVAVADLAGGDWPTRARESAVEMVAVAADRSHSLGVTLLTDLRTVFATDDRLTTEDVLSALHKLEESPWRDLRGKPLTARDLSYRLGKYGVRPHKFRVGDRTARGYLVDDLRDPFARYLAPLPSEESGTSGTSGTTAGQSHNRSTPRSGTHPEHDPASGTDSTLTGPDVPDVPDVPLPRAPQGQSTAEPGSPRGCTVCGLPLHPALADAGETTHPSCTDEGALR